MYSYGDIMKEFENELDEIRIKFYEETKKFDTKTIIENVNFNASKITHEFYIIVEIQNKKNNIRQ